MLIAFALHGFSNDALPAEPPLVGWETLTRLDRLAEIKPAIEVGSVSSFDRTGGNDDGFSGKHSFIRKEGDGLVLADLEGPGVIYRLWTPTPTDDWIEFYFDGESQPRLRVRFRELFLGTTAPFLKPLAGYGVGGFFSYVPLPYAKSCKVVARAERVQFYQINYARYAAATPVVSWQAAPTDVPGDASEPWTRLRAVWNVQGGDLAPFIAPPGAALETERRHITLAAGAAMTAFERSTPGRIVGLRLRPIEALRDKQRQVRLRIAFDGLPPSVDCPLGDFFGFAWGEPAMASLLVGANPREAYCHFPMPWDRSVKLELVSDRPAATVPVELDLEVTVAASPRRTNELRFGATWRRENPTTVGRPFTFIDLNGRGHLVGFVQQAQGFESGKTLFFEGDDVTTLDGRQAVHGTGSEDFYNGGWYDVPDRWEKRLSFPLSGCLGYQKHLGRTGGYRLLLGDAYSFNRSATQTIEHSGTGNDILTDYVGVTYFYSDEPAAPALPEVAARHVTDPVEVVFAAWWQIPIRAFPFEGTTLTRKRVRVGTEDVQFLSMRGGASDWVGPPYLYVTCHVPATGRYRLSAEVLRGPEQGIVQLFQNEVPIGRANDLFSDVPAKSGRLDLGTLELEAGDNPVMLKLVGRNAAATALGFDLIQLVCRREE